MNNKGLLIIISGPSGAGKGTVCKELMKRNDYWLSVSATTRLPREGEIEGKNYYFFNKRRVYRKY
jgi:guanylate kinase